IEASHQIGRQFSDVAGDASSLVQSVSNSILPVPRVVDDLFAEHCLADPIVVSIPERITGLKLSPGCFIDIIDNLEFESLERTRMPERAHGEPPFAQRRSRGREKPRPDVRRVTGASAARRLARRGGRSGAGPNQGTDPGCAPNSLLVGVFRKRDAWRMLKHLV